MTASPRARKRNSSPLPDPPAPDPPEPLPGIPDPPQLPIPISPEPLPELLPEELSCTNTAETSSGREQSAVLPLAPSCASSTSPACTFGGVWPSSVRIWKSASRRCSSKCTIPTARGIRFPPCTRQKEIADPTSRLMSSSSPSKRVRSERRSNSARSSASCPLMTASPRARRRISPGLGGLPPGVPPPDPPLRLARLFGSFIEPVEEVDPPHPKVIIKQARKLMSNKNEL